MPDKGDCGAAGSSCFGGGSCGGGSCGGGGSSSCCCGGAVTVTLNWSRARLPSVSRAVIVMVAVPADTADTVRVVPSVGRDRDRRGAIDLAGERQRRVVRRHRCRDHNDHPPTIVAPPNTAAATVPLASDCSTLTLSAQAS